MIIARRNGLGVTLPANLPTNQLVDRTGTTIHVDPNPNTSGMVAPQHDVSDGPTGGYGIQQHTHYQVFRELFPTVNWCSARDVSPVTCVQAMTPDQAAAQFAAESAKLRAAVAASGMPLCPAGSITDNSSNCYYGAGGGAFRMEADGTLSLLPPGTFQIYGVPFGVGDVKEDGTFVQSFRPNAVQRKLIEWNVIRRSAQRLFGENGTRALPVLGTGNINNVIQAGIRAGRIKSGWNPSVDEMAALVPDIALYWINFERNPIQPTPNEHTQTGGWVSWIRRGGYPLSREVLQGTASSSEGPLGIEFCASILCRCPPNGLPSCKPEGLGNFVPYVIVNPSVTDPVFQVALVPENKSWITEVGETLHAKLFGWIDTVCQYAQKSGNPYATGMCTAWGIGRWLQANEGSPDVSTLPDPVANPPTDGGIGPTTPTYPAGTIATFDPKLNLYRVAVPIGAGFGAATPLRDLFVPAPTHNEVTTTPSAPATAVLVSLTTYQLKTGTLPWYKNPRVWAVIGASTAAVGTGSYVLYRRRRRLTTPTSTA